MPEALSVSLSCRAEWPLKLTRYWPLAVTNHPSPLREPRDLSFLTKQPFAHRGLHGPGGAVENSFAAFDRAIENGFGIELDVQMTIDKSVVVFHDDDLSRLTASEGRVSAHTTRELAQIKLNGTDETIRSLRDAIIHIRGRAPLLIEAKSTSNSSCESLCRAIRRAIEGANGWVAVMSFDPRIVGWFAEHSPLTVRGLVITEDGAPHTQGIRGWISRRWAIYKTKPHFLAYDIRSLPSKDAARFREKGGDILTWTVRSADERKRAEAHADQIIFEQDPDGKA